MGGARPGGHNHKGPIVAEASLRLDIRELRNRGCLVAGRHGSIEWSRPDGSKSSIAFKTELHAVNLAYTWTDHYSGQENRAADRLDPEHLPSDSEGGGPSFFVRDVPILQRCFSSVAAGFQCRACACVAYASEAAFISRASRLLKARGAES